jgi:hypothetical protein
VTRARLSVVNRGWQVGPHRCEHSFGQIAAPASGPYTADRGGGARDVGHRRARDVVHARGDDRGPTSDVGRARGNVRRLRADGRWGRAPAARRLCRSDARPNADIRAACAAGTIPDAHGRHPRRSWSEILSESRFPVLGIISKCTRRLTDSSPTRERRDAAMSWTRANRTIGGMMSARDSGRDGGVRCGDGGSDGTRTRGLRRDRPAL